MTWNPAHLPDQNGRTLVVTGATAGIGYFAAEQLAGAGADVVLASRSASKLERAAASIRDQVPGASVRSVVVDLASLESIDRAADTLRSLPRLDGLLLNGGAMTLTKARGATTQDGLPLLLGTHVVSTVRLLAGILPALVASAEAHAATGRIVHTSTGFVSRFPADVSDPARVPRLAISAYTKAKTVTEVFAFELDRRLRANEVPVQSLVARPGVGVDAKTPERAGIRDATTPYQRNPYTPWAQGKDTAAWSSVRALTDPQAEGGEYYSPTGALRGQPTRITPLARTHDPDPETAASVWAQLEDLAGATIPVPALR